MGTTAEKLTYLNTTKQLIKESINLTDANITTQPFRQYATILKHRLPEIVGDPSIIWNNYEHVTGSGTSFSITAYNSIIDYSLKGNTTQNGTPTPTSPIPINVVSGDNEINVCGENILPQDKYRVTSIVNGITYTNNGDGTFNLVGTATANTTLVIIPAGEIELEANQPYYLYSSVQYDLTTFNMAVSFTENGTSKFVRANYTYTPTTTPTNERLQFYIASGQSINQTNIKLMLVKGSTAPTNYEPYIGHSYPIYLGVENLLEPKMATTTQNGITCTNNGDGSFTLNGTATGGTATGGIAFRLDQSTYNGNDNLKNYNGTYTLSCNELINGMQLIVMQNQTWNFLVRMLNSNTPKTFTANKDNCFIYVYVESGITLNNLVIKPQLEKGSKANSFSPYGTAPIELCKIGTYQDYIYKDNGSWYLHKEITKYIFTGNETGILQNSGKRFDITCSDNNMPICINNSAPSEISQIYCNILVASSGASTWSGNQGISYNTGTNGQILVSISESTTAQTYLDALKDNYVYYVLATPTNTEITDVNLIYQLNGVSLITGLNNISVSGDLPATLDLTALKYE